jgi:DnaJ-class molecular chaperone
MNPGDEAPSGTPGTGEDVCPVCQGTGRLIDDGEDDSQPCPNCGGTGVVTEGIGGG